MKNKAIARITDEAMKIDNPVAFAIEEHLTSLCTTDAVASLLLAEEKTLKGAYDKVWAEARKRKKGNCAYIPEDDVYKMVDDYYGIKRKDRRPARKMEPPAEHVDVLDLF